jgi:hypothetical protein
MSLSIPNTPPLANLTFAASDPVQVFQFVPQGALVRLWESFVQAPADRCTSSRPPVTPRFRITFPDFRITSPDIRAHG